MVFLELQKMMEEEHEQVKKQMAERVAGMSRQLVEQCNGNKDKYTEAVWRMRKAIAMRWKGLALEMSKQYREAVGLYQKAADLGDTTAMYNLAICYKKR